jgi:hypothetical protein
MVYYLRKWPRSPGYGTRSHRYHRRPHKYKVLAHRYVNFCKGNNSAAIPKRRGTHNFNSSENQIPRPSVLHSCHLKPYKTYRSVHMEEYW